MRYRLLASLCLCVSSTIVVAGECDDNLCQCVDYCKENGWAEFSGLGSAYKWWYAATEKEASYYVPGYDNGDTPHIGSVLVFKPWKSVDPTQSNPYGHVAIVAKIINNEEILVNHANWRNDEVVRYGEKVKDVSGGHWTKVLVQWGVDYGEKTYDTYGFIYQKGTVAPTTERITLYRAGTVGWYPTTDVCSDASEWYRLSLKGDGTYAATGSDSGICSEVAPMCYAQ